MVRGGLGHCLQGHGLNQGEDFHKGLGPYAEKSQVPSGRGCGTAMSPKGSFMGMSCFFMSFLFNSALSTEDSLNKTRVEHAQLQHESQMLAETSHIKYGGKPLHLLVRNQVTASIHADVVGPSIQQLT